MKTRRQFLRTGLLTSGGLLMFGGQILAQMRMGGGGMMGGGMMGMGQGGVIDPPPGAAFKDPAIAPNVSTTPGLVEINLEAKVTSVNVNGTVANLLTYNGCFPGPTIRVRHGDRLRINFLNSLALPGNNIHGHDRDISNVHTHGLHVSPKGNSDNPMVMLKPGDKFLYEYDLSKEDPGHLNFYHPHIHGAVAEQMWAGLGGALEMADETELLAGYETHLLYLKDISLVGNVPAAYGPMDYMHGKEGDIVMVNGQVNPVLKMKPGQVQRWRIINGSTARFYKLSLEGHSLFVAGAEGGPLDKPYQMSAMLLSPGERVDLLIKASHTPKQYKFLSLPYNRGCGIVEQQVTLMTVDCQGAHTNDELPAAINPKSMRINPAVAKTEQIYLGMMHGQGFINGIMFEMVNDKMNSFIIHSRLGTYEIWEVYNHSMMDHPFHQHMTPGQVLAINGGDPEYAAFCTTAPVWKDVVVIPRMGSARILMPVMDYDGTAMFHCHIVEHEDIGMMGLWEISGDGKSSDQMAGMNHQGTSGSSGTSGGDMSGMSGMNTSGANTSSAGNMNMGMGNMNMGMGNMNMGMGNMNMGGMRGMRGGMRGMGMGNMNMGGMGMGNMNMGNMGMGGMNMGGTSAGMGGMNMGTTASTNLSSGAMNMIMK